jgi:SAM-dependent methyltransferase
MNEWWIPFFEGSWIDLQRGFFDEETTARQTELAAELLGVSAGDSLLDVPCGPARIGLGLAAMGIDVTGVDLNGEVIEEGRRRAARSGVTIDLHRRDMRDLPWENRFDAALCFWGSFGYLDDDGDRVFVSAVARALKPGGRFLIDTHSHESLLPKFQPQGWTRCGEFLVVEERRFDHRTSRSDASWMIFRDGRLVEEKTHSIRIYTYRELTTMLEAAGFVSFDAYGGVDRRPFAVGSGRLYLVATRGDARDVAPDA